VNVCLRLQLTCHHCQPATAAGFIYWTSQEWVLHSPNTTGFVYLEFSWIHASFFLQYTSLPAFCNCSPFLFKFCMWMCPSPTLQWNVPHFSCCWTSSLLQAHRGKCHHICLLWTACLFTVHVGKCPFPPSLVELSTGLPLLQGSPTPRFLGRGHHSWLFWLVYSQFMWGCAPSPLCGDRGVLPSLLHIFFFSCLFIIQFGFFFLFSLGRGQSIQGLCWFVPGSTTCFLFAHLVVSQAVLGAGIWWYRIPLGFSI
jgi:hypothetical protein